MRVGTIRLPDDAGKVVETVTPTNGQAAGWTGLVVGLVMAAVAVFEGSAWVMVVFGLVMSTVSWAVLLRPRVLMTERGVLLANVLVDTYLPWTAVDRASVRQTLMIVSGSKTYHGVAGGRTGRQRAREGRQTRKQNERIERDGSPGLSNPGQEVRARQEHIGVGYAEHLETQLAKLADQAQDTTTPGDRPRTRRTFALDSGGALTVALVAAVVALLV